MDTAQYSQCTYETEKTCATSLPARIPGTSKRSPYRKCFEMAYCSEEPSGGQHTIRPRSNLLTWDNATNFSRLVTWHVSCESIDDVEKNVHEHGMDLSHMNLAIVFESTGNLTHVHHIFFGDFNKLCCLWRILGLGQQRREHGG